MRKRIYEIIEAADLDDTLSRIYDVLSMIVIIASLIPLTVKSEEPVYIRLDHITVIFFIIDYILRLCTADYKLHKGKISFLLYPFTMMAVIDLLSIIPSLTILNSSFKLLKITRLTRTFRIFRAFKAIRYSKNVQLILNVFKAQKDSLLIVCGLAVSYIMISALIIFNIEPETFHTLFDAIYWATVSLTTVGYGDIYPVSTAGKVITMLSSIFGIAIVALPAGIITAGYMEEIKKEDEDSKSQASAAQSSIRETSDPDERSTSCLTTDQTDKQCRNLPGSLTETKI
ncbi:MAG: ion transporter [Eubacteriaceae bacterium]|jgi:voltage-gated potassium channel